MSALVVLFVVVGAVVGWRVLSPVVAEGLARGSFEYTLRDTAGVVVERGTARTAAEAEAAARAAADRLGARVVA